MMTENEIWIDSNEPDDLVEDLRNAGFKVVQKQLRCYKCNNCGRWFPDHMEQCPNCKSTPDESTPKERVADITNPAGAFGIERKAGDFYSSVISGQLYDQMDKLEEAYGENGAVVLEDNLQSIAMDHPKQRSWLMSMRAEAQWVRGIHFNDVDDRDGLIDVVKWANAKAGKPKKQRVKREMRRAIDPRLRALMNCDNVGMEAALTLAFLFGSLENIMKQPRETIAMLYGFGDSTLDSLEEFFKGKIDFGTWQPKKPLVKSK